MDELLDPAVIEALPAGCEVVSVTSHGDTSWAAGYKVEVQLDGEEKRYFLKILQRERHAEMARGEYESQLAMWRHIPDNVVVPVAHGTLRDDDSKSFYLALFRVFQDQVPEPTTLVNVLLKLQSSAVSPNGKFGFHVPTFNGYVPLINDWCDTWEEWFTRQLQSDIKWEQSIRGRDDAFNKVAESFFKKVIPRLLRPLETGGRSIEPVLIHGDLWHGNVNIDGVTGELILFDSCCCYGHNEMEMFMMGDSRYVFSNEHFAHYKKIIEASEPKEDFEERNTIYAMRDKLINSGLHEHKVHMRHLVKKEMERLLEKYPNGIDDFIAPSLYVEPEQYIDSL